MSDDVCGDGVCADGVTGEAVFESNNQSAKSRTNSSLHWAHDPRLTLRSERFQVFGYDVVG